MVTRLKRRTGGADGLAMAPRVGFQLRTAATSVAAVACLAAPAGAFADHPVGTVDGEVPSAVEQALGGEVTELPDGLYEVDLRRGPDLTTHGPDTQPEIRFDHGSSLGPGDPERPPVCASDYYQHVLYAHRASDPSDFVAATPLIQATMRRINAALNEESLESGGVSADYKVLCDGSGAIQVDEFVVNSGTSFNSVVSAARSAGFDDSNVDYTIFFDYAHPSICGVGSFTSDESLSAGNANNAGGDYGITYDGCWNGTTTMHENGHNQGAVQYNAPFSTGDGAHCWDENDVMCYSPDGGDLHQQGTISRCADRLHFDCGHDDYFDPAPESCEYLATHWNLGSRFNRFITFGGGAANTPPCASFAASCAGLSCSFADASSDPEGVVAGRSWDFGDGATSTAASPSHTYANPGTYGVTLTVTDAGGATDTETRSVTVSSVPPPDDDEPSDPSPAPNPGTGPGDAPGAPGDQGSKRLLDRTPLSDSSAAPGGWRLYTVEVPRKRSRLAVTLDCAASCPDQLDLYLRGGSEPTLTAFDCRSAAPGSDESCRIRLPRRGTWHVGVHTAAGTGGAPFEITARVRRQRAD